MTQTLISLNFYLDAVEANEFTDQQAQGYPQGYNQGYPPPNQGYPPPNHGYPPQGGGAQGGYSHQYPPGSVQGYEDNEVCM